MTKQKQTEIETKVDTEELINNITSLKIELKEKQKELKEHRKKINDLENKLYTV